MINWLKRQWREHTAETAFLLIAVVFGLLFVFVVPPTQAADETTHFYRAYQLSEGHILSTKVEQGYGAYLPRDVQTVSKQLFGNIPSHYERLFNYHQIPGLLKTKINSHDLVPVHLEGSTVYSPVPYIPQILAIWVARIAWPSVALMYYLGRLANLLVWIALMYLAIRLWPYNKWSMFALALIPMSLSQGATMSPDALTNSLAFATIAGIFYLAHKRSEAKLTNRQLGLILLAIVLLALCKPVFFVLAPLVLILNRKQLGGRQRYLIFASITILAALIVTAVWNGAVSAYSVAIQHYYYPAPNVDKGRQLVHIIKHPLGFAYTLGRTYISSLGDLYVKSFIGRLGWWDVDMPIWLIAGTYTLMTLSIINREPKEPRFTRRQQLLSGAIFVAGFLAISGTLYLTLTPVGEHFIVGMQGRYFIPFTPLLIPVFGGLLEVKDWNKKAKWLFPISYSLILTTSLIVVLSRFI